MLNELRFYQSFLSPDSDMAVRDGKVDMSHQEHMEDFLDYLEDMMTLVGCPFCQSFNVRILDFAGNKLQICSDCGRESLLPPAN
jgi:transposase-like protein